MVTKEWFFKHITIIKDGIVNCGPLLCNDCPFNNSNVQRCDSSIIVKEHLEYKRIKKNLEQW